MKEHFNLFGKDYTPTLDGVIVEVHHRHGKVISVTVTEGRGIFLKIQNKTYWLSRFMSEAQIKIDENLFGHLED
jgi:hypothetical protein